MSEPDALAALRLRFKERARMDRVALADALARKDRAALLKLAHGLSGVAGIFGHGDVSAQAALVEEAIDEGGDDAVLADLVGGLIARLDEVSPTD